MYTITFLDRFRTSFGKFENQKLISIKKKALLVLKLVKIVDFKKRPFKFNFYLNSNVIVIHLKMQYTVEKYSRRSLEYTVFNTVHKTVQEEF